MRRVGEDLIAHARRRILFRHFLDRMLQRLRARLILARADEIDAAVVRVRPPLRRDRGKRKQQQKRRALHRVPPASWGIVAVAGSANAMLSSCSWPAFTSTFRVIGERNAGLDSVISYVPGARSTGAGVTNGAFNSIVDPFATLRMLVTSPHGNAFSAMRPGATAIGGGAIVFAD